MRDLGYFDILLLLLLELAKLLLLANCRRANKIWSASIVAGAQGCSHCEIVVDLWSAPSFVCLNKSKGAIGNLFLNSYQHVRGLIWVWIRQIAGTTGRELHFRMGIILGTISVCVLVFYVLVPECSRNGSGKCPYL